MCATEAIKGATAGTAIVAKASGRQVTCATTRVGVAASVVQKQKGKEAMTNDKRKNQEALKPLEIDLSGISMEEIEVYVQPGARALPDMAASCACNMSNSCCSSCGPAGSPLKG
jgi:hypothetical protein